MAEVMTDTMPAPAPPAPPAPPAAGARHGLALGTAAGWAALTALGFVAAGALTNGSVLGVRGGLLATPALVALGLALVATLQWAVLRAALPGTPWAAWVLATLGGQLAGTLVVGVVVMAPLALGLLGGVAGLVGAPGLSLAARAVSGAVLGAVIGAAQWLVLRRRLPESRWWIAAVSLANAVAALVPVVDARSAAPGAAAAFLLDRLAYGAVLGAVTGLALAWLVRSRPDVR